MGALLMLGCVNKETIYIATSDDNYIDGQFAGEAFSFASGTFGYSMSYYNADVSDTENGDIVWNAEQASGLVMTRLSENRSQAIRIGVPVAELANHAFPKTFSTEDHNVYIQWVDMGELGPCPYITPELGDRYPGELTIDSWNGSRVNGRYVTKGAPVTLSGSFSVLLAQ